LPNLVTLIPNELMLSVNVLNAVTIKIISLGVTATLRCIILSVILQGVVKARVIVPWTNSP
jgi:hypothetical protein